MRVTKTRSTNFNRLEKLAWQSGHSLHLGALGPYIKQIWDRHVLDLQPHESHCKGEERENYLQKPPAPARAHGHVRLSLMGKDAKLGLPGSCSDFLAAKENWQSAQYRTRTGYSKGHCASQINKTWFESFANRVKIVRNGTSSWAGVMRSRRAVRGRPGGEPLLVAYH
ncbi:hypothetical protein EVAR_102804_1 [Eumeta japonica]|uniref:Uncharacterized protein n=1 Tax=Eumeta variegata TaxID=151549 RepID=A0A4C1TL09_EUMVA|nr:hypothetical protein EVAR_102804_1 [Eumeta japonica]